MEIKFNISHYSMNLEVIADNVHISEDTETREYFKTPEGLIDVSKAPKRDINGDYLDMISRVLMDMIYYRKESYNSKTLIEELFQKLSPEDQISMAQYISKHYLD